MRVQPCVTERESIRVLGATHSYDKVSYLRQFIPLYTWAGSNWLSCENCAVPALSNHLFCFIFYCGSVNNKYINIKINCMIVLFSQTFSQTLQRTQGNFPKIIFSNLTKVSRDNILQQIQQKMSIESLIFQRLNLGQPMKIGFRTIVK